MMKLSEDEKNIIKEEKSDYDEEEVWKNEW